MHQKGSFYSLGDSAITVEFGSEINEIIHNRINAFIRVLERGAFKGLIEIVPAYTTVTIYYNPLEVTRSNGLNGETSVYEYVKSILKEKVENSEIYRSESPAIISVPVCYGGEFGTDLDYVASVNGLTTKEVINIHSEAVYLVYMIGFAPGFPYLGGMSAHIATPRKDTPSFSIPAGSVGIAGHQTGMYPISTPGGWQIIGRTPLRLFRPEHDNRPSLLKASDRLRFIPISEQEFKTFKEK
jgi:inhibitor of KinA